MLFFRRKKRPDPPPRRVHDISPEGTRRSLNLKEPEFHFEVRFTERQFAAWLRRHRRLTGSLIAALSIIVLATFSLQSRASVVTFHAGSCLGGWEGPQHAEGVPETSADAAAFTADNSAVLRAGSATELFCGGFTGDIPAEASLRQVRLKLYWTLKNEASEEAPALPEPEVLVVPEGSPPATIDGVVTDTAPEEPEVADEPSAGTEPAAEPEPPSEPVPPPAPEPEPVSQPESVLNPDAAPPTDSAPSAFFSIVKAVAAEEDPGIEAPTSTDPAGDAPGSPEAEPLPFLEVLYSTDGATWTSLAKIERSNWENMNAVIPAEAISGWEDIGKLQVRLQSIFSTAETPAVYLDAVALEAEYDIIPEAPAVEESGNEITVVPLGTSAPAEEDAEPSEEGEEPPEENSGADVPAMMSGPAAPLLDLERQEMEPRRVPLVLDPNARHSCRISPFVTRLTQDGTATIALSLEGDAGPFDLLIGDMPYGVTALFKENNSASLERQSATSATIILARKPSIQKGSLGASVFAVASRDGHPSAAVCQFNLILE